MFLKSIAVFAALYLFACALLFVFQRAFLFAADKTVATPAELNLPKTEIVKLTAADGVTVSAWLSRAPASPRLVIYFHGNGGSLAWRGSSIQHLLNLGLSVLATEYRGYGDSDGSPSEAGLERDAETSYDYALSLGYTPEQILLYGESLGSGVAVTLASRRPVGGLILDSPFTSIADVAAARFWMFPVRWLIRDPFWSGKRINAIHAPILILHGTADRVVPIRFGRALFCKAGSNAAFLEVEGGEHIALHEESIQPGIQAWLKNMPAVEATKGP